MALYGYSDLRARGMRRRDVDAALERGELRRLLRGVYVDGAEPDSLDLRTAAVRLRRDARGGFGDSVVCLRTAAWLHGIDSLPPGRHIAEWPVQLAVAPGTTPPRIEGCKGYQLDLESEDVVRVDGLEVTSLRRTALDCGRLLPRLEGQAAMDQFVRTSPAIVPWLRERAEVWRGSRGAKRLRSAAAVTDPRVESPGESWSRATVVAARLPIPEPQIEVQDSEGRTWARLDNGYRDYRVAIEYDGEEHHSGVAAVAHDEARRREVERQGWTVIVVRQGDIWSDSVNLQLGVWEALLGRGYAPEQRIPDRAELVRIHTRELCNLRGSEYLPSRLR